MVSRHKIWTVCGGRLPTTDNFRTVSETIESRGSLYCNFSGHDTRRRAGKWANEANQAEEPLGRLAGNVAVSMAPIHMPKTNQIVVQQFYMVGRCAALRSRPWPLQKPDLGVISVHMPGLDRTSRLRDARSNGSCGLTSLNWWPHQSDLVATLFHISVPNRFRLRNARSTGSCVLGRGVWAAEDLVAKLYRGGGQFFLQEPHRRPWSTIRFLGHFMGLWTQVHRAALQPNSYICRLGSRFLYAGASLREVRPLHLLYSLLSFMAKWKPCLSRRVFLTSVRDKSILYTPRLWAGKME